MKQRAARPLPWLGGLLALYLIAPLLAGAEQVGFADWHSVDVRALLQASAISIASASVSTLVIAIGGVPLGFLLARSRSKATAYLGFIVQLPLALPPLTSGILLLFLVGYTTPIGRLAQGWLTDTFIGIVLAEVFVAAPFLIIAARSGFAAMDPVLEGVAATLGRKPLEVFLRVSLPVAWPSIMSGLLLAWLRAFGEFGATVMVAYHPYSLPVYTYVAFGAQGLPAMLPVLLPTVLVALAIMGLSAVVTERRRPRHDRIAALTPLPQPFRAAKPANFAGRHASLRLQLEKQLDGFHLHLSWAPEARRLAIVGPSGSGKSLILKLVAGLERCDRGSIVVNRRDLAPLDPASRRIAYVPQNYGLFPHLTLAEQLRFPAGVDVAAAASWIDRLGLRGLEQRHPAALSLGQQQRVALARALTRPAELLLLDEPFSALDAPLRARLRQELLALQQELTTTTILVTHDPAEAALLADEILVLEHGRALQVGHTDQVYRRPADERVARLLGADNVATGIVLDTRHIGVGGGIAVTVAGPPLVPGARVGWSFSPARSRTAVDGPYQGRIEAVSSLGVGRQITVRLGSASFRIFDGETAMPARDPCWFDIDPNAVQVWSLD